MAEQGEPVILLVEDDPDQFIIARRRLAGAGVSNTVLRAATGEEALSLLASNVARTAVMLLDVNLPGITGPEVLAEIRQRPELQGVPVFMLSGSSDGREAGECLKLGARAFLAKPLEPKLFLETIAQHGVAGIQARPRDEGR